MRKFTPLYDSYSVNAEEVQEEKEEHSNIIVDNSYFVDSFW